MDSIAKPGFGNGFHCPANVNIARQRGGQRDILLTYDRRASKMMKMMTFSIFTKSGLQRRTSDMQNSSYREARDLRLLPSDAKYNKVSGKNRGSEI